MCCSSKFQWTMVLGKKLYFIVYVLQLYGMYHRVGLCERDVTRVLDSLVVLGWQFFL